MLTDPPDSGKISYKKNGLNHSGPAEELTLRLLSCFSTLDDVKTILAMLVSMGTRRGKSGNIPVSSVQTLL